MNEVRNILLTDLFLRPYVSHLATIQSRERKLDLLADPAFLDSIPSSSNEMRHDWENACDLLTLQIAEGTIPFTLISSNAYYIMEGSWWKMVKQASAYLRWKVDCSQSEAQHYDNASRALRQRLFADQETGSLDVFEKVKSYITQKYLDDNGKVADATKCEAHALIESKAKKISETTGENRSLLNWFRAKVYVSMFYENIIGAVINKDVCKTAMVLRAFEFSKSQKNRYIIINGFEALVAIYFLDKDIVKSILKDTTAFDFSCVAVEAWPAHIMPQCICAGSFEYNADQSQVTYLGSMTEEERDALIEILIREDHKSAVTHLYDQSHLYPYEDMVL